MQPFVDVDSQKHRRITDDEKTNKMKTIRTKSNKTKQKVNK